MNIEVLDQKGRKITIDSPVLSESNFSGDELESSKKTLGNKKLKIFSFFSGAGFLDLGFEKDNFDVEFVNENHLPFLNAYKFSREKMGIRNPAFGYSSASIETFKETENLEKLKYAVTLCKSEGNLVGFIGGPPCPDFSIGGKNKGQHGKKGALSADYIQLICDLQPDFFLFENVKGLWRTKKHRQFFDQLCEKVEKSGYSINAQVLNSLSFGVAQDRERVILFGVNNKLGKNVKPSMKKFKWTTLYDGDELKKMDWPEKSTFQEDSEFLVPNNIHLDLTVEHWFRKNEVNSHPNARHHFTPRAGLAKFLAVQEGDTDKKSYKRLHRWRYSPTAAYGNNEVHLHPYKARRLSAAEAMAIQSLPKEFELPATMTLSNMFKTIGNGVPFVMSHSIASQLSEFLLSTTEMTNNI